MTRRPGPPNPKIFKGGDWGGQPEAAPTIMGDLKTNEVIIATYSIVVEVVVTEMENHIVKKVTYPDVIRTSTAVSVLQDAAKTEELYLPGSQALRSLTG